MDEHGRPENPLEFHELQAQVGTAEAYGRATSASWGDCMARHLPQGLHYGAAMWVLFGVMPGGFLTRVVENDLFGALGHADDTNRRALHSICTFFYNGSPPSCYGSDETVTWWRKRGGLLEYKQPQPSAE